MNSKPKNISIDIIAAKKLSNYILKKWGFSVTEYKWITQNMLAAEMVGKSTHGLTRLQFIKKFLLEKANKNIDFSIINQSSSHIFIDAKNKLGFQPIYEGLKVAYKKLKKSPIVLLGIKDCLFTGYVGDYAYETTQKGFIYIGFHNSTAALIPHGASVPIWGTNPITTGVPSEKNPVIFDAAMSQISGGQVLLSQKNKTNLPIGVAMDKDGNFTRDPFKSVGLLSHGHKGSGLAYMVELLAGALTNSKVGNIVPGGWGSLSILINPSFFRNLSEFKNDVNLSQKELKEARKEKGVKQIYFPGEQSALLRLEAEKKGSFLVSSSVYEELIQFTKE